MLRAVAVEAAEICEAAGAEPGAFSATEGGAEIPGAELEVVAVKGEEVVAVAAGVEEEGDINNNNNQDVQAGIRHSLLFLQGVNSRPNSLLNILPYFKAPM